jgi:hypothetical protein
MREEHSERTDCVKPWAPVFGRERLCRVRALLRAHPGWTRTELARRLCRLWQWRRLDGGWNVAGCLNWLRRLEARGEIVLPASRRSGPRARVATRDVAPMAAAGAPEAAPMPGQLDLREVQVRLISPEERSRWEGWMDRYHYLGRGRLVGESLRYVAEWRGQWLALSGWAAASWKNRCRDLYIGWDAPTRARRLHLVANHVRYLILPWVRLPNLASYILGRNVRRLGADWQRCHGHPVLLAETFVDLGRFRGSCYRAANWRHLGQTRGYGRRGDGYAAHGAPKGVFVYALTQTARQELSTPVPEASGGGGEGMSLDLNALPLEGMGGLIDVLKALVDPRKRRGKRHPFAAVLGVAVCATLSGAKSYQAIAEYAQDLSWDTLKRFGFWVKAWGAPSEPTIRRVLQASNVQQMDAAVGRWLQEQAGHLRGKGIAIDGKSARGSGDGEQPMVHLLSAVVHQEGTVLHQVRVDQKSNEIKALRPLLQDLDIQGAVVTADALHTQEDAARFLVEEKKADYVFIVKDNQPTLREDIAALEWSAFPPSGHGTHDRQGARASGGPVADADR